MARPSGSTVRSGCRLAESAHPVVGPHPAHRRSVRANSETYRRLIPPPLEPVDTLSMVVSAASTTTLPEVSAWRCVDACLFRWPGWRHRPRNVGVDTEAALQFGAGVFGEPKRRQGAAVRRHPSAVDPRLAPGPRERAGRHGQHAAGRPGDRRHPDARRERRLRPWRDQLRRTGGARRPRLRVRVQVRGDDHGPDGLGVLRSRPAACGPPTPRSSWSQAEGQHRGLPSSSTSSPTGPSPVGQVPGSVS
jgi:hypothetical protein